MPSGPALSRDLRQKGLVSVARPVAHAYSLVQCQLYAGKFRGYLRETGGLCADWVEYAIDTDGAKHLLTPRNEMSYYAYHSIDVGVVWATLIALLLLLVALLLRLFWSVLYTLAKLIVPTKQKQH